MRRTMRMAQPAGARVMARLILAMAAVTGAAAVAASTVTASLDRGVVPVGEMVTLSLTFVGEAPSSAPGLPQLPHLQLGNVSHARQINIVNGRATTQTILHYTLIPTQAGEVIIPSIEVAVGNTVLKTEPLRLTILPAGTAPGEDQGQPQWAILRLVVPKNEVYVGEAFPLEIHLYWQNARDIRTPQLQADGFSLSQGQNPNYTQTQTQVGNRPYNLLIFRMAASAVRAGQLTLGPATCDLTLLLPAAQPRRRDSLFDFGPFDFFGNRARSQPVKLPSDTHAMNVLPLPSEAVPESFTGAVGQYRMSLSAEPTNIAVGDPITVRVRIEGKGLLDQLTLPRQSHWRDFKMYPPSARVESEDPIGLVGAKVFEQVVIPQNHEIQMLPPLVFSYFDWAARAYRTLSNAPVALQVGYAAPAGAPLPALTNAQERVGPGADDIVHIRALFDGVVVWQKPLIDRPWFLTLQGIPVVAWLGLLVRRKRRDSLADNPRLRRQKEVARRVREALKALRRQAEAEEGEAFFATLFRLLQEQLGERLDLPASAITESVIDLRLRGGKLSESSLATLHQLFQACNQARYAPEMGRHTLVSLVPQVESILQDLQRLRG